MTKVLIPSATLVSPHLQKMGMLPAIIYPVNKNIVFDYLFKQYHTICDSIDILCYENSDKVHQRLSGYPSDKIHIIDLPSLGDLGHTVYYGIKNYKGATFINFGDTIVMEDLGRLDPDSFYYAQDYQSDIWTFFDINNGEISSISDKSFSSKSIKTKGKLFVGLFYISDAALFTRCLEESFASPKPHLNSFYQALQMYSKHKPLKAIETDNWLDIGHENKYYDTTLEVKAREFNTIQIDRARGILRKTSKNIEKFIGEIKWYLKLPIDLEYVRPRIFSYSTSYTKPFLEMEYYSYHTLHELFLYSDFDYQQWREILSQILFVCRDFGRYTVQSPDIKQSLEDMYLHKTTQRLNQLRKNPSFTKFFNTPIRVNDKVFKPLNEIIALLQKIIPQKLYNVDRFPIIHGDLCFANIMIDSNCSFIKLIDPRGKFGKFDIYGDYRYELAKLFHSIDGKYDFIIQDKFVVNFDLDKACIDYSILDRTRDFDLYELFLDIFKDEINGRIKELELIESLLFFSMIPLHGENLNHQIIILATALELLNRVENIQLKEEQHDI